MRLCKLRIAWSVGCGIACLLLIAVWVRSYWIQDGLGRPILTPSETTVDCVVSSRGVLAVVRQTVPTMPNSGFTPNWSHSATPPRWNVPGHFLWSHDGKDFLIQFPTWLPVILLAAATGSPWLGLKLKFSLRTMLIATTLVAVVLGLIVVVLRWPAG
jgi:hypothetical protein